MRNEITILVACFAIFVTGCTSTTTSVGPDNVQEALPPAPKPMMYAVKQVDHGRSGAAMVKPAVQHVLSRSRHEGIDAEPLLEISGTADSVDSEPNGIDSAPVSPPAIVPPRRAGPAREAASVTDTPDPEAEALRRAWERLCDTGIGMTDEDWRQVEAAGGKEAVPASMLEDCVLPK